ncbi:MAG: hypothetical protein GC139_00590 [Sideroxydans sp.]|nr:hypothetical protein [Sideroxydans sp.]
MKWFKRFLVAVMLFVLLATTTAYLTPLDVYVPEIEQTLSENFGEPVRISHLKLDMLPLPHLALEGVQLGARPEATAQSVGIFFDLHSLLKSQRVIHSLVLDQGSITQEQLTKILAWLRNSSVADSLLRLEELRFTGMQVVMPTMTLGPLEGKLELAADSSLKQAAISMADQKFAALIYPQPGGVFQVEAGFRRWSPPGYPGLPIDSMNISGILAEGQFTANRFSADLLGTRIDGTAHLAWQPEWKLDISMDAVDGDLGRWPSLGDGIEMAGRLQAKGRLEGHGADVRALPASLFFDADVDVKNAAVRLPLNVRRMLLLDSATAHVVGTMRKFRLDKLVSKLYGGTLHGAAVVQPGEKFLDADVSFNNIAVQPLVEALNNEVMLTGSLSGQAKFSARMNEFQRFPDNVDINSNFRLKKGVLGKIDLVQAASNPLKSGNKGGQTKFDELSGLLSVNGSGYHLKNLKVSSGALNAAGKLDVSPQLQLSGLLDTDLKGTATLVSMPLAVSGTVRDPVLHPTGSALAGAAVGTALLGPGLGTALGIKVGNLLNKLFGAKNDKIPPSGQKNPAEPPKPAEQPSGK